MKQKRSFIVIAMFLAACGGKGPTHPDPTPSPEPSSTPPAYQFSKLVFPLGRVGSQFADLTGPVRLWGAIPLDKSKGWPLINQKGLDELAQFGINWTHIRLGPHGLNSPDSDTAPVGDFWNRVEDSISYAETLGIATEVDCIDCWVIKHGYNFWGWDIHSVQTYPSAQQREWIRQIVEHTSHYPNVMYQDGNECGLIDATREWADGVRQALRPSGRLIGTNTDRGTVQRDSDYIQRHGDVALTPIAGKPTMVNETGPYLSPEEFEQQLRASIQAGTYFVGWRGDLDEAGWLDMLNRSMKVRLEYESAR